MAIYQIDFEPIGRRTKALEDETLLSAAQKAGVSLAAVCGGVGVCGACKVRLVSGQLSPPNPAEKAVFSEPDLADGWRLACQAWPRSDVKIEIPPESLTTQQRLQMEGLTTEIDLMPAVGHVAVSLQPPALDDLTADLERLSASVEAACGVKPDFPLSVMTRISSQLRQQDWQSQVVFGKDHQVITCLPSDVPLFGLAVDIGTTKMAAFLVDLATGKTVARQGAMNPQIAFGEDVVSRIAFANQGEEQRRKLQTRLVETINHLLEDIAVQAEINLAQVVDFVVVGNTAMHHLFAGLGVRQLGEAPYVAAVSQPITFFAHEIGLVGAPGAKVYMPPNIAGYIGADHVAMLLASDARHQDGITVALDIGTNTEISLSQDGRLVSCSCASGPAFEGAHIHAGMRAIPGAVERASFFDGRWHLSTIDDHPPVGICGSGILDIVAELLTSGQIDAAGRFTPKAFRFVEHEKGGAIVLVPAAESGTGEPILVTRQDIREIQLAKAAIRAGIDALLNAVSLSSDAIDHFIVAGAFGTYLTLESAIRIGMFPKLPMCCYAQIGNAAGVGAQQCLISTAARVEAEGILSFMSYIELTADQHFMANYVEAITFES